MDFQLSRMFRTLCVAEVFRADSQTGVCWFAGAAKKKPLHL